MHVETIEGSDAAELIKHDSDISRSLDEPRYDGYRIPDIVTSQLETAVCMLSSSSRLSFGHTMPHIDCTAALFVATDELSAPSSRSLAGRVVPSGTTRDARGRADISLLNHYRVCRRLNDPGAWNC